MGLHRQHAAWLLGLEGLTLLRYGAGDDVGDGFLDARLDEVRRIVDAVDHEMPLVDIGSISVRDGYAIWATTYDGADNPLFEPEVAAIRPLLDALPIGRIADVASGTGRHAAHLAERGHEVIAFDLSPEMLAHGPVLGCRPTSDPSPCPTPASTPPCARSPWPTSPTSTPRSGSSPGWSGRAAPSSRATSTCCRSTSAGSRVRTASGCPPPSRAAHAAGLEIVTCLEPRWPVMEGGGGPLAQAWCPAATAAAYRDVPAAIVWAFRAP